MIKLCLNHRFIFASLQESVKNMIIGNPYQFLIFIQEIGDWNIAGTSLFKGVLLFCIDGELFPNYVGTATLACEINPLMEKLNNIAVDEESFWPIKYRLSIERHIYLDSQYGIFITIKFPLPKICMGINMLFR